MFITEHFNEQIFISVTTNAQKVVKNIIQITLTCFGALTPSLRNSQVLSAKVMDYWIDKTKYRTMSLWYNLIVGKCGHICN
jgi:hypothetical protein